jgi:putative glycosyltransferase (TIGR04372 family)
MGLQHSARNIDIYSFTKVVKYLAKNNVIVFRMGDPSMVRIDDLCEEHNNLYDYAHMKCRTPRLDLVLSANCMFFVGNSSGAGYMATIFNRPLVAVGVSLPFNFCPSGFERDFGIPKLFRKIDTGDLCSFKEIFENGLSECRTTEEVSQRGYEFIENTAEEIKEVVAEMFERLNGSWSSTDFDEQLQHKAQSLIPLGSYTFGSKSRCGTFFLRRYSHLVL